MAASRLRSNKVCHRVSELLFFLFRIFSSKVYSVLKKADLTDVANFIHPGFLIFLPWMDENDSVGSVAKRVCHDLILAVTV